MIVERLAERRRELEQVRAAIDEELTLIDEMLSGDRAQGLLEELGQRGDGEQAAPDHSRDEDITADDIMPLLQFVNSSDLPVWQAAVRILEEVGRPLSLAVLVEAISRTGRQFGGEKPTKALASHVSQKPEFLYQEKGWVYLNEWREAEDN